jgi:hypothetical protein
VPDGFNMGDSKAAMLEHVARETRARRLVLIDDDPRNVATARTTFSGGMFVAAGEGLTRRRAAELAELVPELADALLMVPALEQLAAHSEADAEKLPRDPSTVDETQEAVPSLTSVISLGRRGDLCTEGNGEDEDQKHPRPCTANNQASRAAGGAAEPKPVTVIRRRRTCSKTGREKDVAAVSAAQAARPPPTTDDGPKACARASALRTPPECSDAGEPALSKPDASFQ